MYDNGKYSVQDISVVNGWSTTSGVLDHGKVWTKNYVYHVTGDDKSDNWMIHTGTKVDRTISGSTITRFQIRV